MRIFFLLLLTICNCFSATYYVATNGVDTADGSLASPLSLSAINSKLVPGDVAIFQNGVYKTPFNGFNVTVSGTKSKPIILRGAERWKAVIYGTWKNSGSYVYTMNMMFTCPIFPANTMPRFGTGSYTEALLGKTMPYGTFTWQTGTGNKIINNLFINSPGQCEDGSSSQNSEWYGNIWANLGCQLSDNESGESLYLQNAQVGSTKHVVDNISVNAALCGLDLWSQTSSSVNNLYVMGNFLAGSGQGKFQQAPEMNYVGMQGNSNSIFTSNVFSRSPNSTVKNVAVAYFGRNGYPLVLNSLIVDNYFLGNGIQLCNFDSSSSFVNNKFIDGISSRLINNTGFIDRNEYYNCFLNQEVNGANIGSQATWFSNWNNLGYDIHGKIYGSFLEANPDSSSIVIVRPNKYEAGRAHIAVINPCQNKVVTLDLSNCGFNQWDTVKVYNVFDLSKPPEVFQYRLRSTYVLRLDNKTVMKRTNEFPEAPTVNPYPYFGLFLAVKN